MFPPGWSNLRKRPYPIICARLLTEGCGEPGVLPSRPARNVLYRTFAALQAGDWQELWSVVVFDYA